VGYIFQQNTEYQSGLYIPAKHRVSKWVINSSKTQSIKVGYKFQQNTEYQSGLYIPAKHRVSKWVIYSAKHRVSKWFIYSSMTAKLRKV
jgi:elongation factor P hydroxylase